MKKYYHKKEHIKIIFEKKHPDYDMDEIPDWYVYHETKKIIIIGVNQIDLWSGGSQLNRGYKYIFNEKLNSDKSKLLCVVCNDVDVTSKKTKLFKLLSHGFEHNRLCYISNLFLIIDNFFDIKTT